MARATARVTAENEGEGVFGLSSHLFLANAHPPSPPRLLVSVKDWLGYFVKSKTFWQESNWFFLLVLFFSSRGCLLEGPQSRVQHRLRRE